MRTESEPIDELIARAVAGEEGALAELFDRHRDRLGRLVRLRLDHRLQGRIDPSDVLQEAYIDLAGKLGSYAAEPRVPFFLWLRLVVVERLLRIHRQHLGTAMRDPGREISIHQRGAAPASSASLAAQLLGELTSAPRALARAELQSLLQDALNQMDPVDREVIALRHFEDLSNEEVALALNLSRGAASKRYVRALLKLKSTLTQVSGLMGEAWSGAE